MKVYFDKMGPTNTTSVWPNRFRRKWSFHL
jgi:hypothetical protein